ncbi:MAG: TraB/GumN family protein [Saprospiraceae bacterium]|nr:TraB/GumN family protein [Saprospiraceae bacterium]
MRTFLIQAASFIMLLVSGSLAGQQDSSQIDKRVLQDTTKSLLWEVSGNGISEVSWVYGTIHMIGEEDFFLTPSTLESFDSSKQVTFEINMDDMFSISTLLSMMSNAVMDDGLTLKDLLTKEEYQLVKAHFEELGMPLFLFEKVKPLFLSSLASGNEGGLQGEGIKSYEMEFMQRARKNKQKMDGLETVDFQMSLFDSISYKDQAQMLVESIRSENDGNGEFEKMVDLYKSQDIHAMYNLFESEEDMSELEDVLLIMRNKNWIPIMEKMMAEKPTFFAVGAGHLGGPYGVLNLLYQQGYTIKPILD